ncbi:AAA family ATPase [Myxococcota bacterium]|nr:AAA family ATPase [Myxococcota bacterium]
MAEEVPHISVRLFWHDSGWNGQICRAPQENTWCQAHDHIRRWKDAKAEAACAGCRVNDATAKPPCEGAIQAFAREENAVRIHPPEWLHSQGVQPLTAKMRPASASFWPYDGMWTEDGKNLPNDVRLKLAESYRKKLVPGETLVFFYVDERNPVLTDADGASCTRVLAGISTLREVGQIREWEQADSRGTFHQVWAIPFQHSWPEVGLRWPLQEIVARIPDSETRRKYVVALEGGTRTDFRYGSSTIQIDRVIGVLEQAIAALRALMEDAAIPGDYSPQLKWLDGQLHRLWLQRGAYPGLGALLNALEAKKGAQLQRSWVPGAVLRGDDPAALVFRALGGDVDESLEEFEDDLEAAAEEWGYLSDGERALARDLLCRMALTVDQVKRALSAKQRKKHGLPEQVGALLENPYVLTECYLPKQREEAISFQVVDHGVLPHEVMGKPAVKVQPKDPRRFRALVMEMLKEATRAGHTFVDAEAALADVARRSPQDRRCEIPMERLLHDRLQAVLAPAVETFEHGNRHWLALRSVRAAELEIEERLRELAARQTDTNSAVSWDVLARATRSVGREFTLSAEQTASLDSLLRRPLSVLTGAAGTGKSSLLGPLRAAIREQDGQVAIVALAPTGKATVRLAELNVDARTIHRALANAGWYDWDLGILRGPGTSQIEAQTLIIDEMSMVDVELLAMLFRAVRWAGVRRLILVGDYHQLPPIGAGRPFYDLVAQCRRDDQDGGPFRGVLSELRKNYRAEDEGSRAIQLASSFADRQGNEDPQLWAEVAQGMDAGDLRIRYWSDAVELHKLLQEEIDGLRADADAQVAETKTDALGEYWFDAILGAHKEFNESWWQMIAPVRGEAHGTEVLNQLVQSRFHAGNMESDHFRYGVRFGGDGITIGDKVIQVVNERKWRWKKSKDAEDQHIQLFNGMFGRVRTTVPHFLRKYNPDRTPPNRIRVSFGELSGGEEQFAYNDKEARTSLELAYAVTVHKGQGSQFQHVFCVLPASAGPLLSRELVYTALTRAQKRLTLFIQRDIGVLLTLRRISASAVVRRSSRLFGTYAAAGGYRTDGIHHVTARGERVKSKNEVIIADRLHDFRDRGVDYKYEQELLSPGGDPRDLRLPDFTVQFRGRTWYWEHCGLLDDPVYLAKWQSVRLPWYEKYGLRDQLIVTEDGPTRGINSQKIEATIRQRILGEK